MAFRRAWPAIIPPVRNALVLHELGLSSWYRDLQTNAAVGGHPKSQHLLGIAWDLVGQPGRLARAADELRQAGFVVVDEGDHVHVQTLPAGQAERFGLFRLA